MVIKGDEEETVVTIVVTNGEDVTIFDSVGADCWVDGDWDGGGGGGGGGDEGEGEGEGEGGIEETIVDG